MKIIIRSSPASGIFTVLISASLTDCMISISSSHEPFPRSDPDVSVQLKTVLATENQSLFCKCRPSSARRSNRR